MHVHELTIYEFSPYPVPTWVRELNLMPRVLFCCMFIVVLCCALFCFVLLVYVCVLTLTHTHSSVLMVEAQGITVTGV